MQCLPGRRRSLLRRRRLFASASLLLSAALNLGSVTTSRADAHISVDATTPYNTGISGNDDLGDLKRIFQSANSPAELALDQFNRIITDTGMKRTRLLLSDIYCDLDQAGNAFGTLKDGVFTPGDCYPLAWHLEWALTRGLSPHIAVASFMPQSMVQYGPGESWDPQGPAPARYRKYAEALVRYAATKTFDGGASSVIFEISNELDIADPAPENWSTDPSTYTLKPLAPWGRWLWWIDPGKYVLHQWPPAQTHLLSNAEDVGLSYPYGGDSRRLSRQLLPVQKVFSEAIKTVRAELAGNAAYNGKTIELVGPAFAGITYLHNPFDSPPSPTMEEQFLDQTFNPYAAPYGGKFNAAVDRFSFHYYGSSDGTAGFALFDRMVDTINAKLQTLNKPGVRLFLSEWGPTTNETTDINYSHKGAAWVAAFLVKATARKVSLGSYLIIGDGLVDAPSLLGQASLLYKQLNGRGDPVYYPKPVANVFEMFNMMTGMRNAVTVTPDGGSTSTNINAFVTSDDSSASVLVYNYNPSMFDNSAEAPESFTIDIGGLWGAQPYTGFVNVKRYVVDANRSNLQAFLNQPAHPSPELQLADQSTRFVSDNWLALPGAEPLGLGVVLYRIERQSP